jgi:serine protease Do
VSQTPIGSSVKIRLLRKKKEIEVEAVVAEQPKKLAEAAQEEEQAADDENAALLAGLTVRELTPDLARRFGMAQGEKGVVIARIEQNSRAFEAGMRPGDLILQINQKDIATIEDYRKAVARITAKDRILLLIRRKNEDLFVTIKPE